MKQIRLTLALSAVVSTIFVAAPGTAKAACFDPDQPSCVIGRAFCDVTEPAAKHRDKIVTCYP